MKKKILLGLLLAFVLYIGGGIGLIAIGTIDKLYFWPGWSIKGPQANRDKSTFAADGPLVFYRDSLLVSKRIAPRSGDGALVVLTDTLRASDTISCFVSETGRTFQVPLRAAPGVPPTEYAAPPKMLALSDIEGNFKGLELLLRGTGVVDAQLNWSFGPGHLVLAGDFFDRGLNVTECLWLIYKLEHQAEQAGGKVHFILGNHERMNLTGHFKYVRRKYQVNADTLGVPYAQWYDRGTLLGRWLRTKNVAERIGPVLFVHGGISPALAARGLPLGRLNELARASLDAPVAGLTALEKEVTQAPGSPDWYRGLALEEPTEAEVAKVLATYGATTIVIGHTPLGDIKALYHGKVIAIDLVHQEHTDAGRPLQALWLADDLPRIINSAGQRSDLPGAARVAGK